MQTQIDNASDVDALAALFTYTEQEDESNKTTRRISSKGVTWYFSSRRNAKYRLRDR